MEFNVLTHPEQNPEKPPSPSIIPLSRRCLPLPPFSSPSIRLSSVGVLFTHKLVHERRAALALDVAAPVELAVAALVLVGLELIVSSAAAHQLAAVHALRRFVAEAALRAQGACGLVAEAVVRAGVDVDQVLRGRGVEAFVDQLQLPLDETKKETTGVRFKMDFLCVYFSSTFGHPGGRIQYLASNAHGSSTVVLLLQKLSNSSEVGQLEPTCLQTAGTRDSVTLTGHISKVIRRLVE